MAVVSQHTISCSETVEYAVCTWTEIKAAFIRKKQNETFSALWSLSTSKATADYFLHYWNTEMVCKLIPCPMQLWVFYPISHRNLDSEHSFCRSFSQHSCRTTNSMTSQCWKFSQSKDFRQKKKKSQIHVVPFVCVCVCFEMRQYFIVTEKIYFRFPSIFG